MFFSRSLGVACCAIALTPLVRGQSPTPTITSAPSKIDISTITSVSDCHAHGVTQFCMHGTAEFEVKTTQSAGAPPLPTSYSDCHSHGKELWCMLPNGSEVQLEGEAEESSEEHHEHENGEPEGGTQEHCHFHAGVEHCVGGNGSSGSGHGSLEAGSPEACARKDRDYNYPLRIGLLFVILVTSAIGVFGPIILTRFFNQTASGILFTTLKQFGTGIIISTAFVHLYTHASLMFNNPCLGELEYEGTTSAIVMAGIFLSFLVEYIGRRIVDARLAKSDAAAANSHTTSVGEDSKNSSTERVNVSVATIGHHGTAVDRFGVIVLEAGIIFHSLLIGITLVVAGDSFFLTLFGVILIHQFFEGIALGTCIASLPTGHAGASTLQKFIMATAFALVTPVGMAIGIGVLKTFNGNDRSTILAIGTLDALSAGVLVWVGCVEMWAQDWLHGHLRNAGALKTTLALFALIVGMILMSVLGKWA